MRGRRRRVRTVFFFTGIGTAAGFLWGVLFFAIMCDSAKRPQMDGWMMGGCYVGKWAGARRYVGRAALLPGPSMKSYPLRRFVMGFGVITAGPPAPGGGAAPRDATPKHLHAS